MPAEMISINLPGGVNSQTNSTSKSSSQQKQTSSNSDFVSSLEQQSRNKQSNSSSKLNKRRQTNNSTSKRNSRPENAEAGNKQVNNNQGPADETKIQGQKLEEISQEKLKKLKKLLAKDPDELSDKDLEALLANLSKILEKLSQRLSQNTVDKEQIQKLVKSITANQEQLQKLMNNFNSKQSNQFESLLKELKSVQEKFLLNQTQQNNQQVNEKQTQTDLQNNLKDTVQELRKLLQETNAKVIKSSNNGSKSSQNIANQKILSQFNLVKPKGQQENTKQNTKSDLSAIDLKKLGQKLGKNLSNQANGNLKSLNVDKQVVDLKTVSNKNDANLDLGNLNNLKLGQFNTSAEVFNQSAATKSRTAKTMNFQNILNQMNNKINFNAMKQGNKITMQLEPEFLGKIQLKVGVENGGVTAKILAESNQVKELLNGC